MPPSADSDPTKLPTAYRHVKRHEWGLATLAWERDGKRAFRFEDGTERAFPIEYCHLLEEVEGAVVVPRKSSAGESGVQIAFADQVALFREQFPGGFDDPEWLTEHRGVGIKRPLKRHRDGSVAKAEKLIGAEALTALVEAGNFEGVRNAVAKLAGSTDLVPKSHASSMTDARPTETFARALLDMLHGDAQTERQFDAFCRALASTGAKASSWPLTTVLAALVHPKDHVCVRVRILQKQAELLGIPGKAGSPTARGYRWALGVANRVRDALIEAGVPPKDLLDIYDFGWQTLRPAAGEDLARLATARLSGKKTNGGSEAA